MFRKAAQKPGSPGLRHKPPVFLQAKTHAPRPFRSLPQAGTCAKAHSKIPEFAKQTRSVAQTRRIPATGRACAKAHSKISRVCEAKPQRGADTQDPCHRQGRARKRTVTRCKNKIQKKIKNFQKKRKERLTQNGHG